MVDVNKIAQLLNKHFKIKGLFTIDPLSGEVNVQGDVKLVKKMSSIPVQFGDVTGEFNCYKSELTSLVGAPRDVGGTFFCSANSLKNLLGAPSHVGAGFYCQHNQLTSLIGAPRHVGGTFSCSYNQLTNLSGAPDHVGGDFYCGNNPLTSLTGSPSHVGDTFLTTYKTHLPLLRLCMYKNLELEHCPVVVENIMENYAGTDRPAALKAAVELIRAGYAGNAKW